MQSNLLQRWDYFGAVVVPRKLICPDKIVSNFNVNISVLLTYHTFETSLEGNTINIKLLCYIMRYSWAIHFLNHFLRWTPERIYPVQASAHCRHLASFSCDSFRLSKKIGTMCFVVKASFYRQTYWTKRMHLFTSELYQDRHLYGRTWNEQNRDDTIWKKFPGSRHPQLL